MARDHLNKSPRRMHLWRRAVCSVANPRDSYGYHCGLRLASHPDPQRLLTARLDQMVPSAVSITGCGRASQRACGEHRLRLLPRKVARGLGVACVLLVLGGCAVGPDYTRPKVDVGQQYKEMKGWTQASPSSVSLRGDWWRMYGDPVLDGLMTTLQTSNLSVEQAQAQYRGAQAAVESARSGLFPTVGVGASLTRSGASSDSDSDRINGGLAGVSNQFSGSGTVSWEPDLWGKVRRSVESSQAGLQASAADVAATRLSMESTLAQDYFQLRALDAEKRMYQKTVDAYSQSLTITQNRYDAGVSAKADVAQASTQLDNARAQMQSLVWQRAQYEHAIAVLLGKAPSSFSLADTTTVGTVPAIPVGLPSQLLQRRPDVAAAERRTAAANAQIGVAESAWFPDLTLSAQGGFRSGEWVQWLTAPVRFWSLGPELALTLFDGGARSAQVDQARAAYDAQVAAYRLTALTALREVEDYLVKLHVLGQQQTTQNRALASSRESLRLTNNQYDAGLIGYLDVAVVQTSSLNTERAALAVTLNRLVTSVQLIAALGGGWESPLAAKPGLATAASPPATPSVTPASTPSAAN